MPAKVSGEPQRAEDVIEGLIDGDKILIVDQFGKEHWGEVIDDEEEKHVYVEDFEDPVDDWRLPSMGGDQVLKVKRVKDVETRASLAGEFSSEIPFQLPEYTGEAPLSKIKISKETVKNLMTEVTTTNNFAVAIPIAVSKKFEMILKGGRRIIVRVDEKTQVVVDDKTGKPVNVAASEIEGFDKIKCADIPKGEKADASEIQPVAHEVLNGARAYDIRKAVREGLLGAAWDEEHKTLSVICWLAIMAAVSLLNKIFDCFWRGVWWCLRKAWAALRWLAARGFILLRRLAGKIFGKISKLKARSLRRRVPRKEETANKE